MKGLEEKPSISSLYYHGYTPIREPRLIAYLMIVLHLFLVAGYCFYVGVL
jgi:hypothetical protein